MTAGNLRKSLRVDFFHSMRKGALAAAFQALFEFGVRNCFLRAPCCNDGQIVQIFDQLFVSIDAQNHGGLPPFFIGQKLNCRAHV